MRNSNTKLLQNCNFEPVKIGIIGLGYVGLPLAVEFSKLYPVVGFDIDGKRIEGLKNNIDRNDEVQLNIPQKRKLLFTENIQELESADVFIITAPTPINANKEPDLQYLENSCHMLKKFARDGNIFIFESTVYPSLTEKFCVPILETLGKKLNSDFFVGYSPERINPGDKNHTLTKIKKIVSASNAETLNKVDLLYSSIIAAGIHRTKSIQIAEMAKVIENIQRDVNIALINEIALLCKKLEIDHSEVLKAASTKWNFLNFKPGLVGGHCISVDPYYLMHKAKVSGFDASLITVGRTINDTMPQIVAGEILELAKTNINQNILIIGASFKENCNDMRNSGAIEVAKILIQFGVSVDIFDPLIKQPKNFGPIEILNDFTLLKKNYYDIFAMLVPHECLIEIGIHPFKKIGAKNSVFYDFKNTFEGIGTDASFSSIFT